LASVRLVGPGRAGSSLARSLALAGWDVRGLLTRHDDLAPAAKGVDALVVSTPDSAVREVAASVEPEPSTLVLHMSGSLGLDALSPHLRRGSLHPLVPLPDPEVGAARLRSAYFAVSGDAGTRRIVADLGGVAIEVPEESRAAYHAAACIASNHVVALLGQVERVAKSAGVPLEAFAPLTRAALEDAVSLGPAHALTGPVARGDWETVRAHRKVLPVDELPGYDACVELAVLLARAAHGEAEAREREVAGCG
jgi:predicted short-subunit dehydrogenase-like oxidoreductase (DUF2520 family)